MDALEKVYSYYENSRLKKGVIGKTAAGRDIVYLFAGAEDGPIFLAHYAIHAREWLTSLLCLKHIDALERGAPPFGVYFLPALNPDGIALCLRGLCSLPADMRAYAELINAGRDFSLYKANGRGVDLNVNFDADWGTGKSNIYTPAPENFVGEAPFSEPETQALRDFTLKIKPDVTVSYHTKGEEIYWYYGQTGGRKNKDYKIGEHISCALNYPLKYAFASAGGYKDWCIQKLGIPSYTVEAGSDLFSHPLKEEHLEGIYDRNKDVFHAIYKGLTKK